MKQRTIVTIVLGVLLVISLVQAFQLNSVKSKLEDGKFSTGSSSSSTTVASSGEKAPKALPPSLQDLPTMVGGC